MSGALVLLLIAAFFAASLVVTLAIVRMLRWGFRYDTPGRQRWTRRTTTSVVLSVVLFAAFVLGSGLLFD